MSFRNYLNKLNTYFWFTQPELYSFCLTILALAFIYSWNEWGTIGFDLSFGLQHLGSAILLLAITVFVHHAGQRMAALYLGFKCEQKLWWYGFFIGLILVLLSNGRIIWLAATAMTVTLLPIHRLGAFRYGPNVATLAKIAAAGPLANIIFSAIIKTLEWISVINPVLGQKLFVLNINFALWNLAPIPPLDGSHIFYSSRSLYVFLIATIGSYLLMISLFDYYSYIIALLIGALTWIIFITFFTEWV